MKEQVLDFKCGHVTKCPHKICNLDVYILPMVFHLCECVINNIYFCPTSHLKDNRLQVEYLCFYVI